MADDNRGRNGALLGALGGVGVIAATIGFIAAAPVTAVIAGGVAVIAGGAVIGGLAAERSRPNNTLYERGDTLLQRVYKAPHEAARMAIENQAKADALSTQNEAKKAKLTNHAARIHAAEMALIAAGGALELNRVQDHAERAALEREQIKANAEFERDKARDDAAVQMDLNRALIRDGRYDLLVPEKKKGFFKRFSRSGAVDATDADTVAAKPAADEATKDTDTAKQEPAKAEMLPTASTHSSSSVAVSSQAHDPSSVPVNVTIHNTVPPPANEQEFQKQATQLLSAIEDQLKQSSSSADKENLIAQANVLLDGFARDNTDPAQMTFSNVTSIGEVSKDTAMQSGTTDVATDKALLIQLERLNIILRDRVASATEKGPTKSSVTLAS